MVGKLYLLANRASSPLKDGTGAVSFEYVLILGAVSAVVMAAIVLANPSLIDVTIEGACRNIGKVFDDDLPCIP